MLNNGGMNNFLIDLSIFSLLKVYLLSLPDFGHLGLEGIPPQNCVFSTLQALSVFSVAMGNVSIPLPSPIFLAQQHI